MTVSAATAENLPGPANPAPVDMRASTAVRAGTFAYEGPDLITGWHCHDLHQIEYAYRGVVEVETPTTRYLLPPHQAVWVPAGLAHQTTLHEVCTVSVFFHAAMVSDEAGRARVLAASPVLREMIVYASRWPITRAGPDPQADSFFEALAGVVGDQLEHEMPLRLPTSTDPLVAAIMDHTNRHLATVSLHDVCEAVSVSERTLRRRFADETGMTWKRYRIESRMLRAMALLALGGRTVIEVATSVGYESVSAFTRGFRSYVGETPSQYRRRVTLSSAAPR